MFARDLRSCALALVSLLLPFSIAGTARSQTLSFGPAGLSVSATSVGSGGTVGLGDQVVSTNTGDTIAYAWSGSCTGDLGSGSFSNATGSTTRWTAPNNTTGTDQTCIVTLTATATPSGATASVTASETVHTASTSPTTPVSTTNTPPSTITSPAVTLGPSDVWITTTTVASGDTIYVGLHTVPGETISGLNFLWTVACSGGIGNGTLSSATVSSPSWTAPANGSGSNQSCSFTLKVSDPVSGSSASVSISALVSPATTAPTSTTAGANIRPQAGWWYSPSEPGVGFSIEVNAAGAIFFGAYLYDQSGNPVWYVASLAAGTSAGNWAGTLSEYSGGPALGASYQSPKSAVIGTMTLTCTAVAQCQVDLPNGTTAASSLSIQRYAFVSGGTDRSVANADAMPQTGWWWDSAASGLGYFIEVQTDAAGNNTAFIAYYLYASDGTPRWFVTEGSIAIADSVFGSTGGGVSTASQSIQCSGGTAINCTASSSGTVSESFSAPDLGSLTYGNYGITLPIQKFVF